MRTKLTSTLYAMISDGKILVVPGTHTLIYTSGGGLDKPSLKEIYRAKSSYWMYRLFTCFRLTYCTIPLTKNLDSLIVNQAVLPLKGGCFQTHEICWLTKLLVP